MSVLPLLCGAHVLSFSRFHAILYIASGSVSNDAVMLCI